MNKQLYFEDVISGTDIPLLVKQPDTMQLVMWAGASGDYNPIHYDKDYAVAHDLPGVIVHGQLAACFLMEDGKHLVSLKVWAENPRREKTLSGTAVVILPIGRTTTR
jgi:hypothetical protein